ncbi:hypothetical protein HPP92_009640 [Vanilla planifolia]|uniref:Snf2 ATP coupling domain-containing protein n=1 Tax=Vanilla planifolia TaxID=51239 RepID=A0A835V758_VANPL|nr:hypothetical protein HPP92_009640 [Vanilla planifolia]
MGIDAKVIQAGLFNTTSTAQDRREMLEEIMRRGTDSLGTDVPSEREINRLAARNEEEFWLFEKMDEERRQRERYKSRLMEEGEVPDWVYFKNIQGKGKGGSAEGDFDRVLGKRRRREVVYADPLTDLQWMKAVENGEDVLSPFSARGSRRDHASDAYESTTSDEMLTTPALMSDEFSEDRTSGTFKFRAPVGDGDGGEGRGWYGSVVTWKTHKKKRSSHGGFSSSEARGSHGF